MARQGTNDRRQKKLLHIYQFSDIVAKVLFLQTITKANLPLEYNSKKKKKETTNEHNR